MIVSSLPTGCTVAPKCWQIRNPQGRVIGHITYNAQPEATPGRDWAAHPGTLHACILCGSAGEALEVLLKSERDAEARASAATPGHCRETRRFTQWQP